MDELLCFRTCCTLNSEDDDKALLHRDNHGTIDRQSLEMGFRPVAKRIGQSLFSRKMWIGESHWKAPTSSLAPFTCRTRKSDKRVVEQTPVSSCRVIVSESWPVNAHKMPHAREAAIRQRAIHSYRLRESLLTRKMRRTFAGTKSSSPIRTPEAIVSSLSTRLSNER